jgi:hypothetical protein
VIGHVTPDGIPAQIELLGKLIEAYAADAQHLDPSTFRVLANCAERASGLSAHACGFLSRVEARSPERHGQVRTLPDGIQYARKLVALQPILYAVVYVPGTAWKKDQKI